MTPLERVFWGLVVVVVDLRIDSFDLLADPIGWALQLAGFVPLASRSRWLSFAAFASGLGLVLSVLDLLAPGELLPLLMGGLQTLVTFCACTAIMQLVGPPHARTADIIRWLDLGLLVLLVGLVLLVRSGAGVDGGVVLLLIIPVFAVMIWFLVLVNRVKHHPALLPGRALV